MSKEKKGKIEDIEQNIRHSLGRISGLIQSNADSITFSDELSYLESLINRLRDEYKELLAETELELANLIETNEHLNYELSTFAPEKEEVEWKPGMCPHCGKILQEGKECVD